MEITVTPDQRHPQRGMLTFNGRSYPCVLGRSGVARDKREGDGATPTGSFPLRRVLYRADRAAPPSTALPLEVLTRDSGWCDAPDDPAYNTPVTLPYPSSAEALWREDERYDVIVVLGHNDAPVVPGAGSAIFVHVADPDGSPTAGCVALALKDLREVLGAADRTTALVVQAAS